MENDYSYQDSWDNGVYGTGNTQPPKSHNGAIAVLLVLVIFLVGIVSVLGLMNIKLFHQLQSRQETAEAISFAPEEQETLSATEAAVQAPSEEPAASEFTMEIAPCPQSTGSQEDCLTLQEIYSRNIPSVVSVITQLSSGSSSGTGVIVSSDGYIVTNCHVVDGALSIRIRLSDDRELAAQTVGTDAVTDLAVLKIEADDLTPATFGSSESLQVGDSVVAIGDPLGVELRGTMTDGIISAINRDVEMDGRTMSLIQTNAALNPGNSGGPLINSHGQVIGINTMKIGDYVTSSGVEGLGFAIPSATVRDVVDQIIQQGYVSGRPTLGLEGESLSRFYQHYYRMPAGLYLTQVDPGSPAAQAGILEGDLLLSIDGQSITDIDSLNRVLNGHEVGDTVVVTIYRGTKQASVQLTVTEATK